VRPGAEWPEAGRRAEPDEAPQEASFLREAPQEASFLHEAPQEASFLHEAPQEASFLREDGNSCAKQAVVAST
jgi:hypothetical protein